MLQRTLRAKVHLFQAPRISIATSYACLVHSSQANRSQFRAFHPSTRSNTDGYNDLVTTKVEKLEVDVAGLKTDVAEIRTDIKDLGTKLEHSMKEQLAGYALNQEKQFSQYALKQEKQFSQYAFKQEKQFSQYTLNQEKQFSQYASNQEKQFSQYASNQEKQFSQYALNQEKQFSQFYFRCLFGVLGLAAVLVGSSWILPMNESKRLDSEIKRRTILGNGVEKALKGE